MASPDVQVRVTKSREEMIQELRDSDPRFDDVPDDEIAAFLQESMRGNIPTVAEGFEPEGAIPIGSPEEPTPLQRRAVKGLSENRYQGAMASADQDIRNSYGRAAGAGAAAVVAPLAALPLAGAGIGAGLAAAGAGGLAGGLADKGTKAIFGSDEIPQTKKALAFALGADTALSMGADGVMRGIGGGFTQVPKIMRRLAMKSQKARTEVDLAWDDVTHELYDEIDRFAQVAPDGPPIVGGPPMKQRPQLPAGETQAAGAQAPKADAVSRSGARRQIEDQVPLEGDYIPPGAAPKSRTPRPRPSPVTGQRVPRGNFVVDVDKEIADAYRSLLKIPTPVSSLGKKVGGMSPRAFEIFQGMEQHLKMGDNGIHSLQALDGMIEARGSLQQLFYEEGALRPIDRAPFKRMVDALDGTITKHLKEMGPEAGKLYAKKKALGVARFEADAAQLAAEKTVNQFISKAPAALAGFIGLKAGGMTGALASAGAAEMGRRLAPELAAALLVKAMNSNKPMAKRFVERSIKMASEGKYSKSRAAMAQAFQVIGYKKEIRDFLQQQNLQDQQGQNVSPAATGPAFAGPVARPE